MQSLSNTILAPWIQKATALIGKARRVGGNQFRHVMSTLAILIDYQYMDPVLLKASIVHDLIEDVPETDIDELRRVDMDSNEVVDLMLEVTIRKGELKKEYLKRIKDHGTFRAKVLKIADRISNLTDLHRSIFEVEDYLEYIQQTEDYVLPMAMEVNKDMAFELIDLIKRRRLSVS